MQPYDTALTPEEALLYETWRQNLSPNLRNTEDYDLAGAWKANAKEAENGHLPDTFKKPNHITFSNQSMYSTPQTPGGMWNQRPDGSWEFTPSAYNLSLHDAAALMKYFNQFEKGNHLVLPEKK